MPHAKRFPAKALGLAVPDRSMRGKVLPYMPAFQPYWGKTRRTE
jgi:hypothetical protein